MGRRWRIAVGGIQHESHSFHPLTTNLESFRVGGRLVADAQLIERFRGTRTELGAAIDLGCEEALELVPLLSAGATPSGPVTAEALSFLTGELVSRLGAAMPVDAVYLVLHGAMYAENAWDGEAYVLEKVRAVVGNHVPVAVTMDLHANVSPRDVALCDILVGYQTHPHVDGYDRAVEALQLLLRRLHGELSPVLALAKPRFMPHSMNMRTTDGPMREIVSFARQCEQRPGILSVSTFGGFPYVDFEHVGFGVVVMADGDEVLARAVAHEVAQYAFTRRHDFMVDVCSVEEGIARALRASEGPVAVVDIADNPASAGLGDTPTLLREVLRANVQRAVVASMYDPESVQQALAVGVGGTTRFELGGKLDARYGPPVQVHGYVKLLSDGVIVNSGPMSHGLRVSFGPTAVLTLHEGRVQVIVISNNVSPNDPQLLRRHGIEPLDQQLLAFKAKNHMRAAYRPLCSQIIDVDCPGVATLDVARFPWKHVRRPIFPLDDI